MNRKRLSNILTSIFVVLSILAIIAISWAATCGIIYLITLCFNWTFKWSIATGIWLILLLAGDIVKINVTVKK